MEDIQNLRYLKNRRSKNKISSISKSHIQLDSLKEETNQRTLKTARSIEQTSTKEQSKMVLETLRNKEKLKKLPKLARSVLETDRFSDNKFQASYLPIEEENWKEAIAKKLRTEEARERRKNEVFRQKSITLRKYKVIFF